MFGLTNDDSGTNAIDLLKNDHRTVEDLFKQYEDIKDGTDDAAKEELVAQICDALTIHAQIEEQVFYPAARRVLQEQGQELLNEAAVEHQTQKDIVGRLEMAPTSDPLYDAGVQVLSEYVKHHVREEENELFPKVRATDLDLAALGRQLAKRKQELEAGEGGRNGRGASGRAEGTRTQRSGDSSRSRSTH